MSFIDFRSAADQWEYMSVDKKKRIKELLEKIPERQLGELFRLNPDAKRLYEKAVGWVLLPLVSPAFAVPPPRREPVREPLGWTKNLESELRDYFITLLSDEIRRTGVRASPTRPEFLSAFRAELRELKRDLPTPNRDLIRGRLEDLAMQLVGRLKPPPMPGVTPEGVEVRVTPEERAVAIPDERIDRIVREAATEYMERLLHPEYMKFPDWLKSRKGMTFTDWGKLPDAEKDSLLNDWREERIQYARRRRSR